MVVKGCASDWLPVKSGVPQGSVLGPLLFTVFINDIDDNVGSHILKFADDTKVFGPVATPEEVRKLQSDLNNMFAWSQDWQMLFNVNKCKCLHFGFNNNKNVYLMDGEAVPHCSSEKELGIIVTEDLHQHDQVARVVKKANQIAGTIRRVYNNKSKKNIIQLYKSLIRPILEYCMQAWRPYHQQDIDNLEGVQRRVTKMIHGLQDMTYTDRLRETKLLTLEMRRLRGDLIEVFKIMHNLEGLEANKFFQLRSASNLRGHNLTIFKPHSRLNCRKFFFTQRVINEWNNLPSSAVNSASVNGFKKAIKPFLHQRGEQFISQRRLQAPVLLSLRGN